MEEAVLICNMCSAASHLRFNIKGYIQHIRLFHAYQVDFKVTCGIGGCKRSFTNSGTFINHVYDVHGENLKAACEVVAAKRRSLDDDDHNDSADNDDDDYLDDDNHSNHNVGQDSNTEADNQPCCSREMLQKSSATFLLGLKEKFKLTQVSLQGIVQGVTALSHQNTTILKAQIYKVLSDANISYLQVNGLEDCFKQHEHPFMGLETHYQQMQYYKNNFSLIEPVRISLGKRHSWKGSGAKRRCVTKDDCIMYIPIFETLQTLLKNKVVLSEIHSGHKTSSDILHDYCDGEGFAIHPLFSVHGDALQIFMYFDELEVCNPLGSKVKIHKLGSFYFTLGNLSPKYRSKLSSIHLLALVKSTFISVYGMDAVLKPFIEDIKKLEKGVEFVIQGTPKVMYGTVAVVSADNLGSLALGGFKESCSSIRMCRHCMTTKEDSKKKFHEQHFQLRNETDHSKYCNLIENDGSGAKSKKYGIDRQSSLNSLTYFHVCDGSLIPDVMHDLLEGVLQYEVKLLLQYMINVDNYFTLNMLNSKLENLELGRAESNNRPTSIALKTLTSEGNSLRCGF